MKIQWTFPNADNVVPEAWLPDLTADFGGHVPRVDEVVDIFDLDGLHIASLEVRRVIYFIERAAPPEVRLVCKRVYP